MGSTDWSRSPSWKRRQTFQAHTPAVSPPNDALSIANSDLRVLFKPAALSRPSSCFTRCSNKQILSTRQDILYRTEYAPPPGGYDPPTEGCSTKSTRAVQFGDPRGPSRTADEDPDERREKTEEKPSPALMAFRKGVSDDRCKVDGRTDRVNAPHQQWLRQDRPSCSQTRAGPYKRLHPAKTSTVFLTNERQSPCAPSVDLMYKNDHSWRSACSASCGGTGRQRSPGPTTECERSPQISAVTYAWGVAKDKVTGAAMGPSRRVAPKISKTTGRAEHVTGIMNNGPPSVWFGSAMRSEAPDVYYNYAKMQAHADPHVTVRVQVFQLAINTLMCRLRVYAS